MSCKINQEHISIILKFMKEHEDLASGRLSVSNAKNEFKRLWTELSTKLNALGYGLKTTEKWQKAWSDYKGNLKKKAAEIKRHQAGTGGGPPFEKKLSVIEMEILEILGNTFYEGCGIDEKGLEHSQKACPSATIHSETPSTSKIINDNGDSVEKDHSYLPSDRRKRIQGYKRKLSDNRNNPKFVGLYEETLTALKSIENSINMNFNALNTTLNDRLADIANASKCNCKCKCNNNT